MFLCILYVARVNFGKLFRSLFLTWGAANTHRAVGVKKPIPTAHNNFFVFLRMNWIEKEIIFIWNCLRFVFFSGHIDLTLYDYSPMGETRGRA